MSVQIKEEILSILRRKRSYVPHRFHDYGTCISILKKLILEGLVVKEYKGTNIIYRATDKVPKTVVLRDISANLILPNNYLYLNAVFFEDYFKLWYEADISNAIVIGNVHSTEFKKIHKNFWELITFRASLSVVIIIASGKKFIFPSDTIFNLSKPDY